MLLDTSGLFAVYSENDNSYSLAKDTYQNSRQRITTNYVLAEYVALALVRGLPRKGVLEFSKEILAYETVKIIWADEHLHLQAVDLLHERNDKSYSLCDAVSFIVMRERQITQALTADKHFEQEGFVRLLK